MPPTFPLLKPSDRIRWPASRFGRKKPHDFARRARSLARRDKFSCRLQTGGHDDLRPFLISLSIKPRKCAGVMPAAGAAVFPIDPQAGRSPVRVNLYGASRRTLRPLCDRGGRLQGASFAGLGSGPRVFPVSEMRRPQITMSIDTPFPAPAD